MGETPEKIKFRYDDRWSIETAIRQLKRNFYPPCASSDPDVRIYLANIAMLFYDWHALINRTLSPTSKLPLTVTHQELLTAIREIALDCSTT